MSPGGPAASGRLAVSRVAAAILEGAFFLAYPFAVYFAHTRLETRTLGLVLIALLAVAFAIRLRGSLREIAALARQHAGIAVLVGLAIALDQRFFLLVLPAAISLYLLVTFGATLRHGPPMIERFARIVEDDLPDFTLPYCRRVTKVWCSFFAANVVVVSILAATAPLAWWALYNGVFFYVALGGLAIGEFLYRKLSFRYYGDGVADVLLARLFPAERTEKGRRSLAYDAARKAGRGP